MHHFLLSCLLLLATVVHAQKPELVLPIGHTEAISVVTYFPDGTHLLTGSADKQVKLWKADGRLVRTLQGHTQAVHKISVAPSGNYFVSISGKERILWSANGDQLITLTTQEDEGRFPNPHRYHARWSADGRYLALSKGKGITLINLPERSRRELPYLAYHPNHFTFSADGKILYASKEKIIEAYDLASRKGRKVAPTRKSQYGYNLPTLFVPPGKNYLYAAYEDGELYAVNLTNNKEALVRTATPNREDYSFTYQAMTDFAHWTRWTPTPDGSQVYLSTPHLTENFNIRNGKLSSERTVALPSDYHNPPNVFVKYPPAFAHPVATSANGRYTLWRIHDNTGAVLYDRQTKQFGPRFRGLGVPESFTGPGNFLPNSGSAIAFSPDGNEVVVGELNGRPQFYNFSGQRLRKEALLPLREVIWVDPDTITTTGLRLLLDDNMLDDRHGRMLAAKNSGESGEEDEMPNKVAAPLWRARMNLETSDYEINGRDTVTYSPWDREFFLPELVANRDSFWQADGQVLTFEGVEDPNVPLWLKHPNPGSVYLSSSGEVFVREGTASYAFKAGNSVADVGVSLDGNYLIVSHSDSAPEVYPWPVLASRLHATRKQLPPDAPLTGEYGEVPKALADLDLATMAETRVATLSTPDRSFIQATSSSRKEALLTDGQTLYRAKLDGSRTDTLHAHRLDIIGARYFMDDRFILSWAEDHALICWNADGTEPLFTLLFVGEKDWVATTPKGLFDASPGAMNSLQYAIGREILDIGQLKERYYEPGLLPKLLGLAAEGVRPVDEFLGLDLYPEVTASVKYDSLTIRLRERSGGIGRVAVFVNRKEVVAEANPAPEGGKRATTMRLYLPEYQRYFIRHPDSTNVVTVVAYNEAGWLKSQPQHFTYRPPLSRGSMTGGANDDFVGKYRPKFYAVTVGTRDYRGEELDLTYPDKDALAMAIALRESAGALFADRNQAAARDSLEAHCLSTSPQDSAQLAQRGITWHSSAKQEIERVFRDIGRRAKAEDIIVVYFSGHGIAYGNADQAKFYYLTKDIANGNLSDRAIREQYAISTDEISTWLTDIPALKQVLIIDACNSGTLVSEITTGNTKNLNGDQLRALERMKDRTGTFLLSGSAADRVSYEASEYGQGLLTYALIQGIIQGGGTRKYVDVMTLLQYAADEVPRLARSINKVQTPRMGIPQRGSSFDIGMADQELDIPLSSRKPVMMRSLFLNQDTYQDDAKLADQLAKEFRNEAAAGFQADLLYVDAVNFPGGYSVNGLYTVEDGELKLSAKLFRGGTFVADIVINRPSEVEDMALDILDEVLDLVGKK